MRKTFGIKLREPYLKRLGFSPARPQVAPAVGYEMANLELSTVYTALAAALYVAGGGIAAATAATTA